MRRLVLIGISAVLASGTVSTGAEARPRLPGILGAVVGTVGGIVGLRHARARHHTGYAAAAHQRGRTRHAAVAGAPAAAPGGAPPPPSRGPAAQPGPRRPDRRSRPVVLAVALRRYLRLCVVAVGR